MSYSSRASSYCTIDPIRLQRDPDNDARRSPRQHIRVQFDNAWTSARERLAALEQRYDPGSIRHFEALGVANGWRCLEFGGGCGSITEWLRWRVCPSGLAVSIEVNTRFLEALDYENLSVRAHNIIEEELEPDIKASARSTQATRVSP